MNFGELIASNPALRDLFQSEFSSRDKAGKPIRFELDSGQHSYLFYTGPDGEQYCYTPHPDTEGRYWAWTYKPVGKGARTGKARRFKMIERVQFSHRNKAKARALARLHAARTEAQPPAPCLQQAGG